jgi:hypothetical protein
VTTFLYLGVSNESSQFVRFDKTMLYTPFFFALSRGQCVVMASSTKVLTKFQFTRALSCLREKLCASTYSQTTDRSHRLNTRESLRQSNSGVGTAQESHGIAFSDLPAESRRNFGPGVITLSTTQEIFGDDAHVDSKYVSARV